MSVQDVQDSMRTPPAPAFDGNNPRSPLSGGLEGKAIVPAGSAMARSGRSPDAAAGSVDVTPNPVQTQIGKLAPVQGLEQYGAGKVVNAPSSQAKVTPDTCIRNLDPLAADQTPGYGGR